jgi:hypothetical protein
MTIRTVPGALLVGDRTLFGIVKDVKATHKATSTQVTFTQDDGSDINMHFTRFAEIDVLDE